MQYSAEQILMDTTQLYFYFFNKTPNMILKRNVQRQYNNIVEK
jgi:translocation protein SEC63